jgi:hypothetical protein
MRAASEARERLKENCGLRPRHVRSVVIQVTGSRSIVAAALGVALAFPTAAFAGAPGLSATTVAAHAPPRERRGKLEVDATALGESQKLVVDRIHEMSKVVFEREAVRAADGADDPVLNVLIVPLEGDTAGYRITYHVTRSGKQIPGSEGRADCRLCTEGELVDAAVAGIELSVEKMEVELEPEPAAEPVADASEGADPVADPTNPPADDGGKKLGPMGIAGIALTVVGAAGLGTGIGLVVRKPTISDDEPTKRLETKNPGYGALAAGAAVAVTGVVLLVLDLRRARSGATASRRTSVSPWVAAGGGLTLSHRF